MSAPISVKEPIHRNDIAVQYSKAPAHYFHLVQRILTTEISDAVATASLSGLEGSIVIACDAAQMLVNAGIATITSINTSRVQVESRYDTRLIWRSKITICLDRKVVPRVDEYSKGLVDI